MNGVALGRAVSLERIEAAFRKLDKKEKRVRDYFRPQTNSFGVAQAAPGKRHRFVDVLEEEPVVHSNAVDEGQSGANGAPVLNQAGQRVGSPTPSELSEAEADEAEAKLAASGASLGGSSRPGTSASDRRSALKGGRATTARPSGVKLSLEGLRGPNAGGGRAATSRPATEGGARRRKDGVRRNKMAQASDTLSSLDFLQLFDGGKTAGHAGKAGSQTAREMSKVRVLQNDPFNQMLLEQSMQSWGNVHEQLSRRRQRLRTQEGPRIASIREGQKAADFDPPSHQFAELFFMKATPGLAQSTPRQLGRRRSIFDSDIDAPEGGGNEEMHQSSGSLFLAAHNSKSRNASASTSPVASRSASPTSGPADPKAVTSRLVTIDAPKKPVQLRQAAPPERPAPLRSSRRPAGGGSAIGRTPSSSSVEATGEAAAAPVKNPLLNPTIVTGVSGLASAAANRPKPADPVPAAAEARGGAYGSASDLNANVTGGSQTSLLGMSPDKGGSAHARRPSIISHSAVPELMNREYPVDDDELVETALSFFDDLPDPFAIQGGLNLHDAESIGTGLSRAGSELSISSRRSTSRRRRERQTVRSSSTLLSRGGTATSAYSAGLTIGPIPEAASESVGSAVTAGRLPNAPRAESPHEGAIEVTASDGEGEEGKGGTRPSDRRMPKSAVTRHSREFYYLNVKVMHTARLAHWRFKVLITDLTDPEHPTHTFRNVRVNENNYIVFHEPDNIILSPVDDFDWVTSTGQLYGHGMRIEVFGIIPTRTRVVDSCVYFGAGDTGSAMATSGDGQARAASPASGSGIVAPRKARGETTGVSDDEYDSWGQPHTAIEDRSPSSSRASSPRSRSPALSRPASPRRPYSPLAEPSDEMRNAFEGLARRNKPDFDGMADALTTSTLATSPRPSTSAVGAARPPASNAAAGSRRPQTSSFTAALPLQSVAPFERRTSKEFNRTTLMSPRSNVDRKPPKVLSPVRTPRASAVAAVPSRLTASKGKTNAREQQLYVPAGTTAASLEVSATAAPFAQVATTRVVRR